MSLDYLTSTLTGIIHFGIVLGLAVIFHEWGHFIVAKLLGARVDRFAVGFGKPLLTYKWHDTEYALCALPLGGYVKIRGMDPDDEVTGADWEFLQMAPWKRILVVVAGPLMNFVLAFLIYFIIFLGFGKSYIATTTVGYVPAGSLGWEMGLRDGDQILAVNGVDINSWNEVTNELNQSLYAAEPNQTKQITVTIQRDGQTIEKTKELPPLLTATEGEDVFEQAAIPEIPNGIYVTQILPGSPADRAGLKAGMALQKVDGQSFSTRDAWSDYMTNRFQQDESGNYQPLPLTFETKDAQGNVQSITVLPELTYPAEDALPYKPKTHLGISYVGEVSVQEALIPTYPPLSIAPKMPPVIGTVMEGSPAAKAGLTRNSRIVEINDQPVDDWTDVLLSIHGSVTVNDQEVASAAPLKMTWLTPDNEMKTETIAPEVTYQNLITPTSIQTGKRYPIAQIGVDQQADRQKMGVVGAVASAWNRLVEVCGLMVTFIAQLFTGYVSPKLLGGPIAIYQMSGETGRWGLERFLSFIALLSANLGLLNLFPLPPLDGGHVVFYLYEMIRRKPLSMQQMENFAKVGFALIIPLMLWLIINDLSRLDLFTWIKGIFS